LHEKNDPLPVHWHEIRRDFQMSSAQCARCGKTVYATEAMRAVDKLWHKGCFSCAECHRTLTLATFKGCEGNIYCATHVPKPKASSGSVDIAMTHAMNAPKRPADNIATSPKASSGSAPMPQNPIATGKIVTTPKASSSSAPLPQNPIAAGKIGGVSKDPVDPKKAIKKSP
jgi:hypothetical protein